jgi:hypothetical protein
MPTNTDLVTDLPADFEVFGQAVATSMADLLGGTSGQILSKATNTNMDFVWINNDQGDITEVAAGTGISVASGTGPVATVTNSMATAIDAKGDLIVGTAADTFSRLAIGASNGMKLVTDSTTSTGLKYVGLVGVGLTKSASQSISNGTYTAVSWDGEGWDTDTFHDNSTNNSRVTIPTGKNGKYLVTVNINYAASGVGSIRLVNIYKNGVGTGDQNFATNPTFNSGAVLSKVFDLVATDYIQAFVYQDSGGALNVNATATFGTSMQVTYLGA